MTSPGDTQGRRRTEAEDGGAKKPSERRVRRRTRRSPSARRWGDLRELRNLGFYITGLFVAAITLARLINAASAGTVSVVVIAPYVLLGATFILLVMWGWTTYQELAMLQHIAGETIAEIPGQSVPLVVGAALALGGLAVATAWPAVFALMYIILKIVEFLGNRGGTAVLVRTGIEKSRAEYPDDEVLGQALDALEGYYLKRRWWALQLLCVVLGLTGLALGIAAINVADQGASDALTVAAYGVLAGTILLNEAVVAVWRHARTAGLPESYR